MLRVALSGGIASGKSAAATMFRELGVPVIDTDRVARDIVRPGEPGLDALVNAFGHDILSSTGELDRARLRQRIFSDSDARQRVNALLHPLILDTVERELATIGAPYAVIEIPLLVESGKAGGFDRVLVVDAPEEVQVERLRGRDNISAAEARVALAAQASRNERLQLATEVIENSGTLDDLRRAVETVHQQYLDAAKRFATPPNGPSE